MKKEFVFLLLFILASFCSYSQYIILEVSNPFPRVGDECEINFNILKDTTEVSEEDITGDFREQVKRKRDNDLGSGTMKFTNLITDTGFNSVGPFLFNVNNDVIKSNVINLYFDKPLPNETSGIWMRQSFYQGQEYLIIEQRISGEWITTRTSDSSMTSEFKQDNEEFIKIDEKQLDNGNVRFDFSYSSNRPVEVVAKGRSETVSYKISLYKITKTSLFKKSLKLNKSNLKSMPKKHLNFEFDVI